MSSAIYCLDIRIREAAYLFEIEGNTAQSKLLLKQVIEGSSSSDQQDAILNLAKIYDWTGQSDSALVQYRNFINSNPTDMDMTVWVVNRIAALDSTTPQLVLKSSRIPSDPLTILSADNKSIMVLANGAIFSVEGKAMIRSKVSLQSGQSVVTFQGRTYWVNNNQDLSLVEFELNGRPSQRKISLDAPMVHALSLSNQRMLVTTQKTIRLYRSAKELWKKSNQLKDCTPVSESFSTRQVYFNCPDNALHIIQLSDGSELDPISMLDPIDTVITTSKGLFIANLGGQLWHFKPHRHRTAFWQQQFSSIIALIDVEDRIAVLESDGSLNILLQSTGELISRARLEPGHLFSMDGTIGLVSREGNVHYMNIYGQRLWTFQAGNAPASAPIIANGVIHIPLINRTMISLNGRYFGSPANHLDKLEDSLIWLGANKEITEAKRLGDSLLKLEPGNSNAWVAKANYFTQINPKADSALVSWSRASRFSNGQVTGYTQKAILNGFALASGARWVQSLPPSSRSYPSIFGDERNLYTIDADNKSLVAMDPDNGQFKWRASIQKTDQGLVVANDDRILAVASGYSISFYDLRQHGRLIATLDLPGKAFQVLMTQRSIFVSTWNGFVLRFGKFPLQSIWSRKVFAGGSHLIPDEGMLYAASLDGILTALTTESGIPHGRTETGIDGLTHLIELDSLLVLANMDGGIFAYSQSLNKKWEYSFGQQLFSIQKVRVEGNHSDLLIGLANQQIHLFDPIRLQSQWVYQGANSIFIKPTVHGSSMSIDQGTKITQIQLRDGSELRSWKLPDGTGPVWNNGQSILVPNRQGFLFCFPLNSP